VTVARSAGRPPVAVTGHGTPQSTGEQTTTAGEAVPGLWQSGNWRLFWAGGGVSVLGDFVFNVTVMLWVVKVIAAGQTWAPAAASGVLIAAAAPAAAVGPFCGVFIDRWNRKRTMLVADAARTVLIASLVPLAFPSVAGHVPRTVQLGLVYLLVASAACFSQFFGPSRFAMLGSIVSKPDLPKASGILQSTSYTAAIVGPPLAAPLFFAAGAQWALVIDALSFAISFTTIWRIRVTPAPAVASIGTSAGRAGYWREFGVGLKFFATSPVLIAVAIGIFVALLGSGALNTLDVFFLQANLHASASLYGTLGMALGIGGIAGALASGRIAARLGAGTVFWSGLVLAGAAIVGYSRMSSLPPALAFLAAGGVALGAVNAAIPPLMLGATPQHMIGRVESVMNPLLSLASVSSMGAAGILTSTALRGFHATIAGISFGPYNTVFAVAGLLFTAAGLAAISPLRQHTRTRQTSEEAGDHAPQ
jgi:Transmembrane secretion effector